MGFPTWLTEPIPGLRLSTGGLLALADLSTIARRTVIVGGSSWLDSFLLAPGLHYQQSADALVQQGAAGEGSVQGAINAVETLQDGKAITFAINNAATRHYIQSIARPGQVVTLGVGAVPQSRIRYRLMRSSSGMHATVWAEDTVRDLGWMSHVLYLISPVLTVFSLVIMVLLRDWWSLGSLVALIITRVLNIFVIKRRTRPRPPKRTPELIIDQGPSTTPSATPSEYSQSRPTEYIITLGDGHSRVRLRGTPDDLQAITADAWLRAKTHFDGYLEAAAKLLVYVVAALSGNMTQAGAVIFMSLLLASAGLLALSNSYAKSFQMNGRVAAPLPTKGGAGILMGEKEEDLGPRPGAAGAGDDSGKKTPPATSRAGSTTAATRGGGAEDLAEKGQVGTATEGRYLAS